MAKNRSKLVARIDKLDDEKRQLFQQLLAIVDGLEETESPEVKKIKGLIKDTPDPEFKSMLEARLVSMQSESKLNPTEAIQQLYELVGESEVKRYLRLGITTYLNGETWQVKLD